MIMKKIIIKYTTIIVVSAIILFTFLLPEFMVSPGKLIDAHSELETKCFSCHTTFKGVSPQKCTACHKVEEIGIYTTKGISIANEDKNVTFHQELNKGDCLSCHSDHKGVMAFRPVNQFTHNLLEQNTLNQCSKCHNNPSDNLHSNLSSSCIECHTMNKWKPSTFEHEKYFSNGRQELRNACVECHSSPNDALHSNLNSSCVDCHTMNKWVPSTFKHDDYFRFDRNHKTECATCHINKNYKKYTCYGCHEHSRSNIRGEHIEEGIYDYENCVKCHRSGNEHEAERIWKSMRKDQRKESNKYNNYDDDDDDD